MHNNTILGFMADPVIRQGGPRRYLRHLLLLANRGAKVIILMNKNIVTDNAFIATGIATHPQIQIDMVTDQVSRPIGGWALFFRRVVRRQRRRLAQYRPDIMLIYGSCNLLASSVLKRICNTQCVFDPRDNPVEDIAMIMAHTSTLHARARYVVRRMKERYFERIMPRIVDLYCFQTEYEAASYRRRIPIIRPEQYRVLANSARDTQVAGRSHPRPRPRRTLRNILFYGALSPLKGVIPLIQAVHRLIQEGLPIQLQIAGVGEEQGKLEDYIRTHGLTQVSLLGWVDAPQRLLESADLVVVPSLRDALPDVLLESFMVGVATIGSDIGGIRIAINDSRFLFPPGSVAAIANTIRALHASPTLFHAAQRHASEQYARYDFDWAEKFLYIMGSL